MHPAAPPLDLATLPAAHRARGLRLAAPALDSPPRDPLTAPPGSNSFLLALQQSIAHTPGPHALIAIEPRLRGTLSLARRGSCLATLGRVLTLAGGRATHVARLDTRRLCAWLPHCDLRCAAAVAAHLYDAVELFFGERTRAARPSSTRVELCAGVAATPARFDGVVDPLIDLAVWRCEAARFGDAPICSAGAPLGELQRWPALAVSLEWPST